METRGNAEGFARRVARQGELRRMRYGVVRTSQQLPPPSVQRRRLEAAGCDVVVDDGGRSLRRLLPGLKTGDEVLAYGLEAFESTTGELALLVRRFYELGVTLKLVGGSQVESLAPDGPMPRALALLADHEARRPAPPPERRRGRPADAPLTQHQLKFARLMHRRGHSMRAIGLIFRLPPNEMAAILRESPDADDGSEPIPDPPAAAIRPSPGS